MKKDTYMNFFTMEVTSNANATVLEVENYNTGAGVATLLAWRIHCIEWWSDHDWTAGANGTKYRLAVSTRKDLTAFPELIDKGTIAVYEDVFSMWGAGTGHLVARWPLKVDYLPPMLVASPNFSFYVQAETNPAGFNSQANYVRIGFTTEKLTESAYREIFETWNYAN